MDLLLYWGKVVFYLIGFLTLIYAMTRVVAKAWFVSKLEFVQQVGAAVKTGVKVNG